ncbi:hypothetical protein ACIRON_19515 [Nocardioides sp. NPDC101246]|uniref:hypothetical protein n=1 Tax=Nocardioides sp. NPDC101246 TaxID=3364336 RepID=UPI003802741B
MGSLSQGFDSIAVASSFADSFKGIDTLANSFKALNSIAVATSFADSFKGIDTLANSFKALNSIAVASSLTQAIGTLGMIDARNLAADALGPRAPDLSPTDAAAVAQFWSVTVAFIFILVVINMWLAQMIRIRPTPRP